METEAPDGYCASNGQCSPRKENSRMLADLSTSTPNGKATPQGPNSPRGLTIKQEQEDAKVVEGDRRSPAPEEMDKRKEEEARLEEPMTDSPSNLQDGPDGAANQLHNGDRPFQCSQCGVSFTQKGNLLRHIKLHTGEKPFKCPFCSYACRRRDALTGHLRTHAVGKPYKCNFCGRSYKQRTSLEEHKERCHSYLQSVGMDPVAGPGPYSGNVSKELRIDAAEPGAAGAFDRPPVIERLHSTVGKRKSTNPQKFVGEKTLRYSYPELGYEIGLKYDKDAEAMQAHMMDQAINNAMSFLGSDALRPLVPHPGQGVPMVNPLFHHVHPLSHRVERPGSREDLHGLHSQQQPPALPHILPGHSTSNGPATVLHRHSKQQQHLQAQALGLEGSPSNSGLDSADSARSSPHERLSFHCSNPPPRPGSGASPTAIFSGERRTAAMEAERKDAPHRGAVERPVSGDAIRVFGQEGREVRAFQCEHCRVLFLDHVMYTIHMGCHGYREPLECNICGHRSKDRYEFSSHIVRGEHTFQ